VDRLDDIRFFEVIVKAGLQGGGGARDWTSRHGPSLEIWLQPDRPLEALRVSARPSPSFVRIKSLTAFASRHFSPVPPWRM